MYIAYKAKKKGAQNERLDSCWCYMLIVGNHHLLADAESTEDITKYLIGSDFSDDVTEVEDALSKILWNEVAWELSLQAGLYTLDSFQRMSEGFVMTRIADNDVACLQVG